jgi:hypothetical protein
MSDVGHPFRASLSGLALSDWAPAIFLINYLALLPNR